MSDADPALAQLLRQVRRLELRSERLIDGLAAGRMRSRLRGQGMEFAEVREYSPGDDVRHIDWNVTARSGGQAFVKTFSEERDLTCMMLVDCSGSMRFGALPGLSPQDKMATAAEAAAIIGVTALRNQDRIGLRLYTDRCEFQLSPRKGRGHAMQVIRACLAARAPRRQGSLGQALRDYIAVNPKRSFCVLVSDFLQPEADLGQLLAQVSRRHDVVGMRVSDPHEAAVPAGGPLVIQDPETGVAHTWANTRRSRASYRQLYQDRREHVDQLFAHAGCELIDLTTTDSVFAAIRRAFSQRRNHRRGR